MSSIPTLRPNGQFSPSVIPNSGSGGGGSKPAHEFWPEDYGAVGDGIADDTQAWNDCIAAAVAAAPQHNYNVTVRARSAEYLIGGAATPGREYGNAQVSIPYVQASTSRKVVLNIIGAGDAASFLHWAQPEPQSLGTVLKSTLTSGSFDATWGMTSVLGGPMNLDEAPHDEFATFSNMLIVIDGISVQMPYNVSLTGFDFRFIAQANIISASTFSDRSLETVPPISQLPSNDNSTGLVMPQVLNNARGQVYSYVAEGMGTGMIAGEHLAAMYLGFIYCVRGLWLQGSGAEDWPDGEMAHSTHAFWVGHLLVEASDYWVWNGGAKAQLIINVLGGESKTNFEAHLNDSSGFLTGEIHINDVDLEFPVIQGANGMRIINDGLRPGPKTAPALPATGVVLRNPFWRDAYVYISGGTVSAIKVDDVTTGLTSGMVAVPTGRSIAIDYSAAPTWSWVLA